jgi:assimilatory nitrate reductase catalytic subunit
MTEPGLGSVRTTCPYCGVGCGILATPDGKGGAAIAGDPDHPANFGRLCSKGAALGETLGLDGRLLRPRIGGRDASWDEALDLIAERFGAAIREHGPDSVAIYGSGQLLTEDYYVANKLMKGFVGSANIDTNSRLCMASSVAGHRRAFGTDTVPGTYEDLERADLVVLVGSNLAWCHPVLHQRIAAAKEARPGMRVINVDPRRTATCDLADLHLRIRPDGDAALFAGLLREIAEVGALDAAYVRDHVAGMEAALAAAEPRTPARVAAEADLPEAEVRAFFRAWIGTERVVTLWSQGVNQSACGTDKVNAIINCHLATGRIGREGMGPFSVTGQPNAMGGREVGGLANMLAAHLDLEDARHRALVARLWKAPRMAERPGLKAVDLFRACTDGRIKALWVLATNPAQSMPEADAVAAALEACPFVVVSDMVADTDTARRAAVLLPACGWGEKDGTVTNSERRISRQRAFLPTPGEARPDWWALAAVARRLGHGAAFAYERPADVFREHAALSALAAAAGQDFDIGALAGLDDAGYDALAPLRWPLGGPERFFGAGGFFTGDRRARAVAVVPPRLTPASELRLNTGRVRDHWHTMTRTGRSPRLSQHVVEPFVEIHPTDAAALGIAEGDLVAVEADGLRAILRAVVTAAVRPGEVFAPMHWGGAWGPAGRIGAAVAAATDPVSGQPALKGAPVRLRRWQAAWHGYAVTRMRPEPGAGYWAVAKTETGWRLELADERVPEDWEAYARRLFGLPEAKAASLLDRARGQARVALVEEGAVVAALFVAKGPVAVAREHLAAALGGVPAAALLAGRPGREAVDRGPLVCACLGVGRTAILQAVAEGAASVEAVGLRCGAGTDCGSCRPEIRTMLPAPARVAAA